MIYVFLVDTGTMMTFDMNLALESVEVLKGAIHNAVKVPPDKQVLLASGGETLDSCKRVCHYSAGTDTSPIFLFSKVAIEGAAPPTPSVQPGGDGNLRTQVEGCLNMPATYNTVVARTQLAQQFYEHASEVTRTCRQLVHDQHLQQQGWAAVVANLEDIVAAFRTRHDAFQQNFVEYLSGREEKVALLQSFEEDLKLPARIPVFPELLGKTQEEEEEEEAGKKRRTSTAQKKEEEEEKEEEEKEEEEEEEEQEEEKRGGEGGGGGEGGKREMRQVSLLDWISAKDSQSDVRQIAQLCCRGLAQISEGLLEQVGQEVSAVLREADRPQMKEVKGLGERLCGLEQLMHDAAYVVQEQSNFSQALLKNQERAGKVNDPSIFPDLCTSHRKNLMHMLKNHQKLQDIKRRCIKTKEELLENLHIRLKWIMYIERRLYEADTRVSMHQESVRCLAGLLQVVEQIHRAPRVYAAAVTEVARPARLLQGLPAVGV
ncbi:RB1-inducible coiled-coil protein 1-like isoform X2 [Scylla paramamosain]|uniref:RB1-inducible coiled-coil protein 1-like isoform X2 n=1 Tax=Scylla paramamosain TaxID=85552 RepID=UPI00308286B7